MNPLTIKAIAAIVAIAASFAAGWRVHSWKVDAGLLEAMQAHVAQWREAQDKTDALANDLEADRKKERVVYRTITKEVVKYANNPNIGHCTLPADFGLLFDSAASGTAPATGSTADATGGAKDTSDSTVLEVATENFEQCREWRASLIGWQKWYHDATSVQALGDVAR